MGYFAVCFVAISIYLQIRNTLNIRTAERHMAMKMFVTMSQKTLEDLRSELIEIKRLAIKAGHRDMVKFYEIEHKLNLMTENLNRLERQLIAQGLQQPSGKGRLEYMLKLVDLSLANAHTA